MRGSRGQAIVDFALTGVVFFFLVFGIVDMSRALYTHALLTNAARTATRYAIVTATTPTNCSDPTVGTTPCQTAIKNYVATQVTGINTTSINYTFSWQGATSGSCDGTAEAGCYVSIKMTYPFTFVLLPFKGITMKAASEMVIAQ